VPENYPRECPSEDRTWVKDNGRPKALKSSRFTRYAEVKNQAKDEREKGF